VLALTMRERAFKGALAERALAAPRPRRILDLGCGTGTLTAELARRGGGDVQVVGIDGDEGVLARARAKADRDGVSIELERGLADRLPFADASFDRVVSSLLFHHLQPHTKAGALAEALRVLGPGGRLHIADFGKPSDPVTSLGFSLVQRLDGHSNTRDHRQGKLPQIVARAGFGDVEIVARYRTLFGTVDLIDARAPLQRPSRRSAR
jgi:ubiquinone/menaquinone biosynthesis C-methylase UbiE